MNKDLENIFKNIATDFHNKSWKDKVIALGDETIGEEDNKTDFVYIDETNKYAEFKGELKNTARSMKELQPLMDYLKSNGYRTNLY
jgi:hypothetical protein